MSNVMDPVPFVAKKEPEDDEVKMVSYKPGISNLPPLGPHANLPATPDPAALFATFNTWLAQQPQLVLPAAAAAADTPHAVVKREALTPTKDGAEAQVDHAADTTSGSSTANEQQAQMPMDQQVGAAALIDHAAYTIPAALEAPAATEQQTQQTPVVRQSGVAAINPATIRIVHPVLTVATVTAAAAPIGPASSKAVEQPSQSPVDQKNETATAEAPIREDADKTNETGVNGDEETHESGEASAEGAKVDEPQSVDDELQQFLGTCSAEKKKQVLQWIKEERKTPATEEKPRHITPQVVRETRSRAHKTSTPVAAKTEITPRKSIGRTAKNEGRMSMKIMASLPLLKDIKKRVGVKRERSETPRDRSSNSEREKKTRSPEQKREDKTPRSADSERRKKTRTPEKKKEVKTTPRRNATVSKENKKRRVEESDDDEGEKEKSSTPSPKKGKRSAPVESEKKKRRVVECSDSDDEGKKEKEPPTNKSPRKGERPATVEREKAKEMTVEKKEKKSPASKKSKTGESEEGEEWTDRDFWLGRNIQNTCPRCFKFIGGCTDTRRSHYQQYHYSIYYESTLKPITGLERFVGENLGSMDDCRKSAFRVCMECPTDESEKYKGRLALIEHLRVEHSSAFNQFRRNYRIVAENNRPTDTVVHKILMAPPSPAKRTRTSPRKSK